MQKMLKIFRERGRHFEVLSRGGMNKSRHHCVKRLALKLIRRFSAAVHFVAQNRMADVGHVHAYLMGAACFQLTFDIGILPIAFQHFIMRYRRAAAVHIYAHAVAAGRAGGAAAGLESGCGAGPGERGRRDEPGAVGSGVSVPI